MVDVVQAGTPWNLGGTEALTSGLQTVEIQSGDNALLVAEGGWHSFAAVNASAVRVNGQDLTPIVRQANSSGGQSSGLWIIRASDPGWPGVGSDHEVEVITPSSRQQKGVAMRLSGVDQAATLDQFGSVFGNATSAAIAGLNSNAADLPIGLTAYYGASIGVNSGDTLLALTDTSGAALYLWSQPGVDGPTIVDVNFTGGNDHATVAAIIPDAANSDLNANVANKTLTALPATIYYDGPLVANTVAKTVTGLPATIIYGTAPGTIPITLYRKGAVVPNEALNYYVYDGLGAGATILDEGQVTSDASGRFTLSGISAGDRYLIVVSTTNPHRAGIYWVQVT